MILFILGLANWGLLVTPVHSRSGNPAAPPATSVDRVNADLTEALSIIEDKYSGPVKAQTVVDSAIEEMLHTLDPHSAYYNSEAYEQFRTEQQSQYFGVGIHLSFRNNRTYVDSTGEGTPAGLSGIRYGDEIIEAAGMPIDQIQYGQVSKYVRGPRGTSVDIKVRRLGVAEPITFHLVRDAVPQPSVPYAFMISPGIGYIAISDGFNTTTGAEMDAALEKLKAQGLSQLVLDLRGNRGGLTIEAERVVSHFLDFGEPIYSQRGRVEGISRDIVARNRTPEKYPLVLIVDGNSASATEIVAGAIQDHDRGLLVGERTFGKGLIQLPSSDPALRGGGLILTVGRYYTPSGRLIQRQYDGMSYWDYYASRRGGESALPTETGDKHKTDLGRVVYGGRGITPDVVVKPTVLTLTQAHLLDPVFGFAREVVAGQIKGLEAYKIADLDRNHILKPSDYPVTDEVFSAFRAYAKQHSEYKLSDENITRNQAFIKNRIRAEFVTAAYGTAGAYQVTLSEDAQVDEAIRDLPKAKELAERIRPNEKNRIGKQ